MQVEYSSVFKASLRQILMCSGVVYSDQTRRSLVSSIRKTTQYLQAFPLSGAKEPLLEQLNPPHRHVVIRPYFKIIYFVDGDVVFLADLWDTRQCPDSLVARVDQSLSGRESK